MLRISKLTDYGTLIMSQMARHPERLLSASELAGLLGLANPTVSKVLKSLARHGLVTGVRGLRGGYSLSRPAAQITIADIVDALEEQPFGLTECSAATGLCDIEENCRVRASWRTISAIVRRALEDVSVASLAQTSHAAQPIAFEAAARLAPATIRGSAQHRIRTRSATTE